MTISKLAHLISEIESLQPVVEDFPHVSFTYVSSVVPAINLEIAELEATLNLILPDEIKEFWSYCSEIRLFEQQKYFQWGILIKSPKDVVSFHKKRTEQRPEFYIRGDLLIGEFRGDLDTIIVRCDNTQSDFGHILIGEAIDERKHWRYVARSMEEFLTRCIGSPLSKYWENKD